MTKRLFALFLTLVMVFQPVLPAAAEMAGEDPADLAAEEVVETAENAEETTEATEGTEEPTEGSTEATEEPEETTEATNEPAEAPTEAASEPEESTEEPEPEAVPYAVVRLNCDMDGVTIHVYPAGAEDTTEEILPQEDGSYQLLPGAYIYSAQTEDQSVAAQASFQVTDEDVGREIEINIVLESADFEVTPPSGIGETGSATWKQYYNCFEISGGSYMANYTENEYKPWTVGCNYYVYIRNVYAVGDNAFRNDAVQKLTLAETVSTIGTQAFQNCKSLHGVHFPDSLRTIKTGAFSGSGLAVIRLPAKIQKIEQNAFANCPYLDRVLYSGTEEQWKQISIASGNQALLDAEVIYNFTGDGVLAYGVSTCDWVLDGGGQLTIIGDGEIPYPWSTSDRQSWASASKLVLKGNMHAEANSSNVFKRCSNIAEVVIYNNPTLGNTPFDGCKNLRKITFPESWTKIPDGLFTGSGIRSYQVPEQITQIGSGAFQRCASLEEFSFGTNLPNYQESGLFTGCSSLKRLVFPKNLEIIPSNIANERTALEEVVFPENVREIASYAFYNTGFRTLKIPDSVTTIKEGAFENCKKLQSITLPKNITELSDSLFYGCLILPELTIPTGVTKLGSSVFNNCKALTGLKLPEKLTSIGNGAFKYSGITQIQIPQTVTELGDSVFYACESLTEIAIPDHFTSIGSTMFRGCTSLKKVHLPSKLESLSESVFSGCTGLESITLPATLKTIGSYTFAGCISLKKLELPAALTGLGSKAFADCTGLTEISFPGGMRTLSPSDCLSGCTGLTTVTIAEGTEELSEGLFSGLANLKNVTLPKTLKRIGNEVFRDCGALESITIPANVTTIGAQAFSGCISLKKLELPAALTGLGSKAFADCTGLTEISFPGGMRTLSPSDCLSGCTGLTKVTLAEGIEGFDKGFFSEMTSLKTVTLPSTLKTVGEWAFGNCTALESIVIPANVTTIDNYAFYGCAALKNVQLPERLTTIGRNAFEKCTALREMVLPNSVTSIGSSAFYNDGALEKINIPSRLTTINNGTFCGTGLKAVTIPTKVTTIGERAFQNTKLQSITIPQSVTTTGQYAFASNSQLTEVTVMEGLTGFSAAVFQGCSKLTTITVPKSVKIIGEDAFSGCNALKKVRYQGNWRQWCAVAVMGGNDPVMQADIRYNPSGSCGANVEWSLEDDGTLTLSGTGDMSSFADVGAPWNPQDIQKVVVEPGVTRIGASAFAGCSAMEEISLPNTVTQIGASAFSLCAGLQRITLPEGLTSIKSRAFFNCDGLVEITIPSTVQEIGVEAFVGCTGLKTVNYLGTRDRWGEIAISSGNEALTKAELRIRLASGTTGGLAWALMEDGTLTISGGGRMADYSSTQPAPWDKTKVLVLQIDKGVTYIGSYAFAGCTKLDLPDLPEGVTEIGAGAFQGCTELEDILLPASLKTVQKDAFSGCTALDTVYYNGKLSQWGQITVASGNQALTGAKLLYEGQYAVSGSYGKNITWKLNTDGTLTLSGSGKMANEEDVNMFDIWRGEDVKKVIVQQGITCIGKNAFVTCVNLKEATLSTTVTEIGESAFNGCKGLTTISLPGSLKTVRANAFYGCGSLTTVRFAGKQEQWDAISIASGNEALTKAKLLLSTYQITYQNMDGAQNPNPSVADKDRALTLKDPSKTGYIFGGWYKEAGFTTKLTSIPAGNENDVILYAKWTPISYTVKFDANGGTGEISPKTVSYGVSWVLPKDGVRYTGYTLAGWNTAKDGSGTAYGPEDGVWTLSSVQGATVTLYAQWKAISYTVKYDVNGGEGTLEPWKAAYGESFRLPEENAVTWQEHYLTGWTAEIDGETKTYQPGEEVKNLTAKDGNVITFRAQWTHGSKFGSLVWELSSDGTLTISGSGEMDSLDYPWEAYAEQVRRLEVCSGVTSVGMLAFFNFSALEEVELSDTVVSIGQSAFEWCDKLEKLKLGAGLQEIGRYAFGSCDSLQSIEVDGSNAQYSVVDGVLFNKEETALILFPAGRSGSYSVPGSVKTIGNHAFDCSKLTEVVLPSGLVEIGEESFKYSKISRIELPATLTTVGAYAFEGCKQLKAITIPGSVKTIPQGAFFGAGLESLTLGNGIITLEQEAFLSCGLTKVKVPSSVTGIGAYALGYNPNRMDYDKVSGFTIEAMEGTAAQRYAQDNGFRFEKIAMELRLDVPDTLRAGEYYFMKAQVVPESYDTGIYVWSLKEPVDSGYMMLHENSLMAFDDLPEKLVITVVCTQGDLRAEKTVTLLPALSGIGILQGEEHVEGGTLTVDLSETDTIQLRAEEMPESAVLDPEWSWSDTKNAFGTYRQEGSSLTVHLKKDAKPGTITLTVKDKETKKSATVKLTTTRTSTGEITILGAGETLAGGGSVQLKAQLSGNPANSKVVWSLEDEDYAYASLSATGKLTAAQVTEKHTITVHVEAADGGSQGMCQITLVPKAQKLGLTLDGEPVEKTVTVYLNDTRSLCLAANIWPEDASAKVSWSVPKNKIVGTQTVSDGKLYLSSFTGETGTLTVKATTLDGSKKTASLQLKFARKPDSISILDSKGNEIEDTITLKGKQSYTFKTELYAYGGGKITDKDLVWSVPSYFEGYITVKNGKVTVRSFASEEPIDARVDVYLKSDPEVSATVFLELLPDVSSGIYLDDLDLDGVDRLNDMVYTVDLSKRKNISLYANMVGLPDDELVWSSSKKEIASIDRNGNITLHKAGTVTITATNPASKKKASFKLVVTETVKALTVQNAPATLAGGTKVTLKATMTPAKPINGKLTWFLLEDGNGAASITPAGVLTAAKVTGCFTVRAAVKTQDGSVQSEPVSIQIIPAASRVAIYGAPTGGINLNTCRSLKLSARVYPSTAFQKLTWTSSNKLVQVDAQGKVTIQSGAKPGNVTLTATAADGSKKKATVKLNLVRYVTSISMAKNAEVVGGKSLKLTATPDKAATNKKIVWTISGDTAYCTFSNGTLKAKAVAYTKYVTVRATAADGSGVYAECRVKISPKK